MAIFIIGLDLDTSTPFGRVIVIILVALAQFEREMTAVRVRENALARLLRDGKINGASEILGLVKHPDLRGHFVADQAELKQVETLLRMFITFSSKKKVLEEAKNLGVTGKRGRELSLHMLEQVLSNVRWRYRGLWYANKDNDRENDYSLPESKKYQIVNLPHGPLIDTALLDDVQRILDEPARKHKKASKDGYVYLLSHVLTYQDGTKFTGSSAKRRTYRYYHNTENKLRIHCEELNALVLETLKKQLLETPRFVELVGEALKKRRDKPLKLQSQDGPLDLKEAAFDLLKTIHRLPGLVQRSIVERLVKRIVLGENGTLTIEFFGDSRGTADQGETLRKRASSQS